MAMTPGCDGCKNLKVTAMAVDGYQLYWCQHQQAVAIIQQGILIDPYDVKPAWCPKMGKFGLLVKTLRKEQDVFLKGLRQE